MADWLLADELPGTQGHNELFDAQLPLLIPPPALISQTETVTLCMKKGGCDEKRQIALNRHVALLTAGVMTRNGVPVICGHNGCSSMGNRRPLKKKHTNKQKKKKQWEEGGGRKCNFKSDVGFVEDIAALKLILWK